jgi:predicted ribosome quality control (RQC) complex YloA/Tae2 family protein
MANVFGTVKNWFGNYFPRFYIPANKKVEPTVKQLENLLRHSNLLLRGLLDAIALERGQQETLRQEAVDIISCLVLHNGGEVTVNQDIVDTVATNKFVLTIDNMPNKDISFKLEETPLDENDDRYYNKVTEENKPTPSQENKHE